MKFVRLDIAGGKLDIQSVGGLQMSRVSHPQSRQPIQIEAARLEQKIWPHFVAETRNEDEFLRTYAVDDHKKQVYIKLKELYWTLWRLIGRKRSWAEGRKKSRSIHCEVPRLINEEAAALESCFLITKLNVIRTPISTDRGPLARAIDRFPKPRPFPASLGAFLVFALFGGFLEAALGKSSPPAPPSPEQMQLSNGRTAIFVAQRTPGPLLIFLHSGGGNASLSVATSGFATAARRAGVSLVFGDSRDGIWRYNGLMGTDERSDEEYVLELREVLVARGYGSRGVFVAGYSNGGMIALQTVCDHPTLFDGVALISSAVPAAVGENCGAAFPTRFVLVNGTEDPIMPIKGGVGTNAALGPLWSPARLGDALLHRRQCTRLASISIHEKSLGGQSVELFRAVNCKLPGITALYLVTGGKHDGYGDENWKERSSGPAGVFLAPEIIVKAFSGAKPGTRKTKTSLKVPPSAPVSLE
jgi:predicted esterase